MRRYLITLALTPVLLFAYLQLNAPPSLSVQWTLISGGEAVEFEDFQFFYATLPRAVLALLVGGAMGLVGSLLQQTTQNRLLSPMTLGAASGSWLALVCASVWAPALMADYGAWIAMAGASLSVTLVLLIAGRGGLAGLPVVLAGMAVNILLGAAASAIVLLNDQYARDLFIWGAGDLTQTDWNWVIWLAPKLSIALLILLFAHRPLTLLRLGEAGARGRGMGVIATLALLLPAALWLVACSITAVGVISFIGLLTPNLARALGARRAGDELAYSLLLGGLLLLGTDAIPVLASQWTTDLVPSGAAAALIGAPGLIWFTPRKLSAADHSSLQLPAGVTRLSKAALILLALALPIMAVIALLWSPEGANAVTWRFGWPSDLVFSLRWPRIVTAAAAGGGMALAGVILQRLIRNPLASPDILGMSAGASLMLVLSVLLFGGSIYQAGPLIAFAGSLGVLLILLLLGRRHHYAPGVMVLTGISLAALIDALVRFALAKGSDSAYSILGWLAGSTYQTTATKALLLLAGVMILVVLCTACSRWLTLISAGDHIALARGLNVKRARLALLFLASLACALVTAVMGPVAFVGLLAPHMAAMLGARKAAQQLLLAIILGALLMVLSDWLGRTLLYPAQMPAGAIASLLGGGYFIYLLTRRRAA
ncbi:ABC-type Fe3+-siderophore transport system, permease component [Hahella chejuensis KCTC 2396]|uniref:ABC-type Fe3+-siderophore transport system, permease component n=1 Tax=Hahella chejuensis (strain KCTC 2396) TaxID=349521 RepID=Q2SM67_HAHCH|nr:Fe(3+)-hydroxamate ABC transporter permease FhuB [Hahella chejuensis]ABC28257.1 ABC-type Fe3+-siderophore transport system, permease component [Hahella chejuensis KCTC 2396]